MNKKPLVLAVSLAMAALATQPTQAIAATWIGADGWWNDGFNWSTGFVPQSLEGWDGADLVQSDTINRTVYYSYTGTSIVQGGLTIDATGSGTMTLSQTKDVLSTGATYIGLNGRATYDHSGGDHIVGSPYGGGGVILGSYIGANGTYNLSGTGKLSATNVFAGSSGTGTFNQSGGSNTVEGGLILGNNHGNGIYNLSGGDLSVPLVVVGDYGSTGTFNQSGGNLSARTVNISNGSGTYNLSGGDLSASLVMVGSYGSTGTFNQSGGNLSATTLNIYSSYGSPSSTFSQSGGTSTVGSLSLGSSTYNLDGGTLNAGQLSSSGILNLDGGTLNAGQLSSSGILNLNDGALNIIGTSGEGYYFDYIQTLNINGGTFNVTGGDGSIAVNNLVLGKASGSNVNYTMTSTGLYDGANKVASALQASSLTLGDSGSSTFTQSGGTMNVWGALTLGSSANGSGTYNLNGGTLNVGTIVRGAGTGTFNWTGGALNINQLSIGNDSLFFGETLVLDASTEFSAGHLDIETTGTFTHAGGTHNMGAIVLNGITNLDGGTLTTAGSIGGSGVLNLNGGALSVAGGNGTLNVGTLVLGQASGSNGSYTLSTTGFYNGGSKVASSLTAGNLTLGASGTSTFNLAGSSLLGITTLTQNAASKLTGFGIINADSISNAGTINAKSGNLILSSNSFSNTGLIKNSVGSNLFIEAATVNHQGNIEVNSAGSIVFDAAITNATGKNVALLGGTLATPVLTNQAGGNIKGFGTLTGDLVNAGMVEFYGPTNIIGGLTNESGGTLLVKNDQTLITGHTVNNGTIKTLHGKVIFEGGLTNNGAYLSDPSENYFTDLVVNQSGYLVGEVGDKFLISGDFENYSLQDTQWNTSAANLTLSGVSLQNMYLAGDDLGALMSGYANNFAWGELSLVAGSSLKMWDGNGNPGAALYVGLVELGGGLGQLSSIDSAYNIYYDGNLVGNAYLGGQTYALNGGGSLMAAQAVPEASTYAMMLAGLGLVGFMARRRKQAAI